MADHGDGEREPSHQEHLFEETGPFHDPLERQTIFSALDSFHQYRKNAHYNTTHRRRQNLYALPSAQWRLLASPPFSMLDTLNAVDDAIDQNADLADAILQLGLVSFGLSETPGKNSPLNWLDKATLGDISKAHSTIRQFYRDWTHEGFEAEVKPLLETVLSDLQTHLPGNIPTPALLLPGAGLGRLLFELCLRGYNVTGNEISYHQLLASNLILNATERANQYTIYPFANTFTNLSTRHQQLKPFTIPDVHPGASMLAQSEAGHDVGEMNMAAGDFVLSYSTPDTKGCFDVVVTVFFIDTAPNLIRYVETVHHCLKNNGLWINIGPLLWHFDARGNEDSNNKDAVGDDSADEEPSPRSRVPARDPPSVDEDRGIAEPGSVELTDEEVRQLVRLYGFETIQSEATNEELRATSDRPSALHTGIGYIQDPSSLLQNRYRCSHWVARKTAG